MENAGPILAEANPCVKRKRILTPDQRAHMLSMNRKWRQGHKEQYKAACKKYRIENRESLRLKKAAWYAANRDKILANWPAWKAAHPDLIENQKKKRRENYPKRREAIIANVKRNYIKDPAKTIARVKDWNAKHPGRNNSYAKRWRDRNPELKKEINARWSAANPDKVRAKQLRRRARKESNSTPEQIASADAKIIEMLSHKRTECAYCAKSFPTKRMHVEHIVPFARGGAHAPENLCMSCGHCNDSKSGKILNLEWTPPQLALPLSV